MGNVFIVGKRKNPELPVPEISKEELERIRTNVSKYTASRNAKHITNFDRIKQMDEEDLAAEFFNWFCNGYDEYYGMLSGIKAGNHDITHIFGDATLRIGGRDYYELAAFLERLKKIEDVDFIFTISCDEAELPEKIFQIAEKI